MLEIRKVLDLLPAPALLFMACSGSSIQDETGVGPPEPGAIVVVSGNNQIAPAGGTLADTLVIRFEDGGIPSGGSPITWSIISGGGSVAIDTTRSAGVTGLSRNSWTLGDTVGEQALEVSTGLMRATFTATATATEAG